MTAEREELWYGIVPAAAIFLTLCAGFLWAISSMRPITTRDCIKGAHPAIVLGQCAAVQK